MSELDEVKADLKEIKKALVGNPELKQKGLVDLVEANTNYIERDQKFKAKSIGFLTAIQLFGAAIFSMLFSK